MHVLDRAAVTSPHRCLSLHPIAWLRVSGWILIKQREATPQAPAETEVWLVQARQQRLRLATGALAGRLPSWWVNFSEYVVSCH